MFILFNYQIIAVDQIKTVGLTPFEPGDLVEVDKKGNLGKTIKDDSEYWHIEIVLKEAPRHLVRSEPYDTEEAAQAALEDLQYGLTFFVPPNLKFEQVHKHYGIKE